jgi:sugar phosphate isomerase/epimerase
MTAPRIALQMYTLRDFTKTPADIVSTLKRVKKIGYNAVQLSALGKIDPKELADILKSEGLACCATHIGMDRMKNEAQAVIDEHKLWGCEYTAIGGFGWKENTLDKWNNFIREYSEIARNLSKQGLQIGYHNHSHELVKMEGKTLMDRLFEGLDKGVWFEIDTYWIQHGGANPIEWIRKVSGRIPCAHYKDFGMLLENRTQIMEAVGEGNLNWAGIIEASKLAGVKWAIVEQDNCNGKDPFDCIAVSLRNLQKLGLQS